MNVFHESNSVLQVGTVMHSASIQRCVQGAVTVHPKLGLLLGELL